MAIGRNEGNRLHRCLESIPKDIGLLIYVDSGSTDESVETAVEFGASTVELDMSVPFTAARARNAGRSLAKELRPEIKLLQFIDGDCEVADGWLEKATEPFVDPTITAVCGIRRERNANASIFNKLCDIEWRQPHPGEADSFGGDVMIRSSDFDAVGGYDPTIVAAEDDDLSLRLRNRGGRIVRLPDITTIHDADMHHWIQWWNRAVRCGHAYANIFDLHRQHGEAHFDRHLKSTIAWGGAIPIVALVSAFTYPPGLVAILGMMLVQIGKNYNRTRSSGYTANEASTWALFCLLAKLPEMIGVLTYFRRRLLSQGYSLIEYK